jgi:hypothetical protein
MVRYWNAACRSCAFTSKCVRRPLSNVSRTRSNGCRKNPNQFINTFLLPLSPGQKRKKSRKFPRQSMAYGRSSARTLRVQYVQYNKSGSLSCRVIYITSIASKIHQIVLLWLTLENDQTCSGCHPCFFLFLVWANPSRATRPHVFS